METATVAPLTTTFCATRDPTRSTIPTCRSCTWSKNKHPELQLAGFYWGYNESGWATNGRRRGRLERAQPGVGANALEPIKLSYVDSRGSTKAQARTN